MQQHDDRRAGLRGPLRSSSSSSLAPVMPRVPSSVHGVVTSRNAAATQQRILEQAQRQFAQYGYATITVKGVADAAGVSPNLITRYFGSKEGLFLAATRVEIPVADSFDGDRAELGTRLAASIVQRWFGAPGEDPLHRYLRDSGLDDAEARSRAAAIDAFVLGVSTRRRVLRAELGDPGDLQAWLATTIQRLADG